jgi:hypothetical protein
MTMRQLWPFPRDLLVGGDAKRILSGPGLPGGQQWRLCSLCEQDGFLFLRYRPR